MLISVSYAGIGGIGIVQIIQGLDSAQMIIRFEGSIILDK